MVYRLTNTETVLPLLGGWEETLILSCLQGVMGAIYANDLRVPTAAMAILGDFAFLAGEPSADLAAFKPERCTQDFIIMVPQNEAWEKTITGYYGSRAKVVSRYATKKEPNVFDRVKLERIVSELPKDYRICPIDETIYNRCKSEKWSRDLVSQFPTYREYSKLGLGFVIQKNRVIVSGASSYSRYREGIEIEIDTKEAYRRKGLAYVCGAKLILECRRRNLYPSWDAQNKGSLALAEKLGYTYSHTYPAVEIRGY